MKDWWARNKWWPMPADAPNYKKRRVILAGLVTGMVIGAIWPLLMGTGPVYVLVESGLDFPRALALHFGFNVLFGLGIAKVVNWWIKKQYP